MIEELRNTPVRKLSEPWSMTGLRIVGPREASGYIAIQMVAEQLPHRGA